MSDGEEENDLGDRNRSDGLYQPPDRDFKALEQSQDLDFSETDIVSVPSDTYGAFMMSMIMVANMQGGSEEYKDATAVEWIGINLLLHLTNLALQCALPLILISTSIELREQPYEMGLDSYTDLLLESRNRTLPDDTPALVLCKENEVQNLWIYPVVLVLWWSRMIQEFVESSWLLAAFINLDSLEQNFPGSDSEESLTPVGRNATLRSHESVASESSRPRMMYPQISGARHIVALPRRTKVCAVGLVIVPKIMLALFIAWVGTKQLVFSHRTSNLILKALVIQWWLSIDELLYRSYVSLEHSRVIGRAAFRIRKITTPAFDRYGSTLMRMTVVVTCLAVIYYGFYGSVHAFREACLDYKESIAGPELLDGHRTVLAWLHS